MKKNISLNLTIILISLFGVSPVIAQKPILSKEKFSFGTEVILGINQFTKDKSFLDTRGEVNDGIYISLGANCDYRLHKLFKFRSGLFFTHKRSSVENIEHYFFSSWPIRPNTSTIKTGESDVYFRNLELNIPILLKIEPFRKISVNGGVLLGRTIADFSYARRTDIQNVGIGTFPIESSRDTRKVDLDSPNDLEIQLLFSLEVPITIINGNQLFVGVRYQKYMKQNMLKYESKYTSHLGFSTSIQF